MKNYSSVINSYLVFLILSLESIFVYGGKGKGSGRRGEGDGERERKGEGEGTEAERRGKRNKKVRKGEIEGKQSEEIVKCVMHDGGWCEILKLPETTAEERSSKLSFICLCHVCAV